MHVDNHEMDLCSPGGTRLARIWSQESVLLGCQRIPHGGDTDHLVTEKWKTNEMHARDLTQPEGGNLLLIGMIDGNRDGKLRLQYLFMFLQHPDRSNLTNLCSSGPSLVNQSTSSTHESAMAWSLISSIPIEISNVIWRPSFFCSCNPCRQSCVRILHMLIMSQLFPPLSSSSILRQGVRGTAC